MINLRDLILHAKGLAIQAITIRRETPTLEIVQGPSIVVDSEGWETNVQPEEDEYNGCTGHTEEVAEAEPTEEVPYIEQAEEVTEEVSETESVEETTESIESTETSSTDNAIPDNPLYESDEEWYNRVFPEDT